MIDCPSEAKRAGSIPYVNNIVWPTKKLFLQDKTRPALQCWTDQTIKLNLQTWVCFFFFIMHYNTKKTARKGDKTLFHRLLYVQTVRHMHKCCARDQWTSEGKFFRLRIHTGYKIVNRSKWEICGICCRQKKKHFLWNDYIMTVNGRLGREFHLTVIRSRWLNI